MAVDINMPLDSLSHYKEQGNMNLIQAQLLAANTLAEARRFYTMIHSRNVLDTYEQVVRKENQNALKEFNELIKGERYDGLKDWIKEYKERTLTELSVRELKMIASSYGIVRYYQKTKAELIQLIRYEGERRERDINKERSTDTDGDQGALCEDGELDS